MKDNLYFILIFWSYEYNRLLPLQEAGKRKETCLSVRSLTR